MKLRNFYTKCLSIILFLVILNITIKKCSMLETKLKNNINSSINKEDYNYKKYFELSYLAEKEIEKQNYKKAEEYYKKARNYNHNLAEVNLAKLYYKFVDEKEGKKKFIEIYNNGFFEVAYILGTIAYEKGDFNLAKEWYSKGHIKGFENASIELSKLLISENNDEEAKKILLNINNENEAEALYYLMTFYYKENNKEKIYELKNKMLNKNKIYGITDEMIMKINFMLGNKRENKLFELINKADNFVRIKKYEEAKKIYEKSLEYGFEGNYFLGNMYNELNNKNEAIKYYEIAYEKGKIGIASYKIGDIYEQNNNIIEAEKWYQTGIELNDSQSLVSLGKLEFKRGNDKKARELFLKGIDKKNAIAIIGMLSYYQKVNENKKVKEMAERIRTEKGLYYNDATLNATAIEVLKFY